MLVKKKMFISFVQNGRNERFCMKKLHGKTPKFFVLRPLVAENEVVKDCSATPSYRYPALWDQRSVQMTGSEPLYFT